MFFFFEKKLKKVKSLFYFQDHNPILFQIIPRFLENYYRIEHSKFDELIYFKKSLHFSIRFRNVLFQK